VPGHDRGTSALDRKQTYRKSRASDPEPSKPPGPIDGRCSRRHCVVVSSPGALPIVRAEMQGAAHVSSTERWGGARALGCGILGLSGDLDAPQVGAGPRRADFATRVAPSVRRQSTPVRPTPRGHCECPLMSAFSFGRASLRRAVLEAVPGRLRRVVCRLFAGRCQSLQRNPRRAPLRTTSRAPTSGPGRGHPDCSDGAWRGSVSNRTLHALRAIR
jgi:hypothetical protein